MLGIALVGLDLLAVFIPVARPHDVVGGAHLLELAVQAVTKGTGLVAREHFLGQRGLVTHSRNSVASKRCRGCGVPPSRIRTTT